MSLRLTHWLAWIALAPLAWGTGALPSDDKPTNVLFVLIDDVGVDRIGAYLCEGSSTPSSSVPTRRISRVSFTNGQFVMFGTS